MSSWATEGSAADTEGVPVEADAARKFEAQEVIETLHSLRYSQQDAQFWVSYCQCLLALGRGSGAVVIQQETSQQEWHLLGSACPEAKWLRSHWLQWVEDPGQRALNKGFAWNPQEKGQAQGHILLAVRLRHPRPTLLLLAIPNSERPRLNELLLRAQLAADVPWDPKVKQQGVEAESLVGVLGKLAPIMEEERFHVATLGLVNNIANYVGCAQVALGLLQGGYVRVVAISHVDRFERRTQSVQLLEAAFEEALDQEQEVHFPIDSESSQIVWAHSQLQQKLGYSEIWSLPLRRGTERPEAVLLLAQEQGPLKEELIGAVKTASEIVLPWLVQLRRIDRWWWKRLGSWVKEKGEWILGPQYLARKAVALTVSALLLYVLFGTWSYRIEANGQLVTDKTAIVDAPFKGYLATVEATSGDKVAKSDRLAKMGTEELFLKESEIRADVRRYRSNEDKARAEGDLAGAEVAQARQAQARAQMARVQHKLERANIKAPFSGVIVKGERKNLLGSSVKKGEKLFRLADISGLYAEIRIPEKDIRYIEEGASGEITLLSAPNRAYPIEITEIIPQAQVRQSESNQFKVKARLMVDSKAWWRPGMSGVAKVEVGERRIAWILTHRLIDKMRMMFWW